MDTKTLDRLIQTARRKRTADLVLKNANILNVFTGEFLAGDIAVTDGMITGIGRYDTAGWIEYLSGRYVVPGLLIVFSAYGGIERYVIAVRQGPEEG